MNTTLLCGAIFLVALLIVWFVRSETGYVFNWGMFGDRI